MTFRPELFDELLQGYQNPGDLLGHEGILKQLAAALVGGNFFSAPRMYSLPYFARSKTTSNR